MNKSTYISTIFLFSFFFILLSCKKSKDEEEPKVTFAQPLIDASFNVGDTIHVSATVSDNENIGSVSLRLLNSSYTSTDHDEVISVTSNPFTFQFDYIITNQYLATGNYFLSLSVSDRENIHNEYINIHITEIPLALIGTYIVSRSDSFSLHISKLDSSNVPQLSKTIISDYSGSTISSLYHSLFTIGKYTGAFNVLDLNNNQIIYSLPAFSQSTPTYLNMSIANGVNYISFYDGKIRGYDKTGLIRFDAQQQGYAIPDVTIMDDDYLFAEMYFTNTHENKLVLFSSSSGVAMKEADIDIDIKNIFRTDIFHVLLFGNEDDDDEIKITVYDILSNDVNDYRTIPNAKLFQTITINGDDFLLATDKGIYSYRKSTDNMLPFDLSQPAYSLAYDDLSGEVFAGTGNQLRVFDFSTRAFQYAIANTDSVLNVLFLYNR